MKLSLYAASFAMLAAAAAMRSCEYPLRYCASSLRALGYSEGQLLETVAQDGCEHDHNPDHYLFRCTRDGRLAFDFMGYSPVGGCVDRGMDKHDRFKTLGSPIIEGLCPKPGAKRAKPASSKFRHQDVLEIHMDM